jgi:hypothetical protein
LAAKSRLDLYCLCWNDARILPHFFRHYDPWVDRYIVLDNGSTDGSLAILEAHPKVTVEHFDVTGDSFVDEERRLSDSIWRESRGKADWVIMVDLDEFIFHPRFLQYLRACREADITAIRGIGYEMVADRFPVDDAPLVESVTLGVRSVGHDKLCVFDPDALTETNFAPGRHMAAPKGSVWWPQRREVLMLHYKQLGVEYVIQRSAELRAGLRDGDVKQGWGRQYLMSPADIAENWVKLRSACEPVRGLGSLKHVAPADYDDESVLAESGLFDAPWYLEQYPDVGTDPARALSHFCSHGWKEDRKPNFYFQPSWYLGNTAGARQFGRNPLLHYYLHGERTGAKPSTWFEPGWYREHYRLDESKSPLAHYLAKRVTGLYSPNPDFDVKQYCADRPRGAPEAHDPFEESVLAMGGGNDIEASPEAPHAGQPFPSYEEVVAAAGVDSEALRQVLRQFIQRAVVDEAYYLRTYPDVAEGIVAGYVGSAREHFIDQGYFEGRSARPDPADDS